MPDLHSHDIQLPISIKRYRIFRCFAEDINAIQTVTLAGVNRSTVKPPVQRASAAHLQDTLQEMAREAGAFELAARC